MKAQRFDLAEAKLLTLTTLVTAAVDRQLEYGFNEWLKSQDGILIIPFGHLNYTIATDLISWVTALR